MCPYVYQCLSFKGCTLFIPCSKRYIACPSKRICHQIGEPVCLLHQNVVFKISKFVFLKGQPVCPSKTGHHGTLFCPSIKAILLFHKKRKPIYVPQKPVCSSKEKPQCLSLESGNSQVVPKKSISDMVCSSGMTWCARLYKYGQWLSLKCTSFVHQYRQIFCPTTWVRNIIWYVPPKMVHYCFSLKKRFTNTEDTDPKD